MIDDAEILRRIRERPGPVEDAVKGLDVTPDQVNDVLIRLFKPRPQEQVLWAYVRCSSSAAREASIACYRPSSYVDHILAERDGKFWVVWAIPVRALAALGRSVEAESYNWGEADNMWPDGAEYDGCEVAAAPTWTIDTDLTF